MQVPRLLLLTGLLAATAAGAQSPHAHTPLLYEWDYPRCGASGTEMARIIADCMHRVMYPRGATGDGKPEVHVNSAALVCRQTRSLQMSQTLSQCMRGVLFERSGLGARRKEIDDHAAATACRYATERHQAENVESCMRRLLYDRDGLGYLRTDMSPEGAAFACQAAAAPAPPPWPFSFRCRPPEGEESIRFITECINRLTKTRQGLGHMKTPIPPETAAVACEGAISWYP